MATSKLSPVNNAEIRKALRERNRALVERLYQQNKQSPPNSGSDKLTEAERTAVLEAMDEDFKHRRRS